VGCTSLRPTFCKNLIGHWNTVDITCYVYCLICLVVIMLQVTFDNLLLNELCMYMYVCMYVNVCTVTVAVAD